MDYWPLNIDYWFKAIDYWLLITIDVLYHEVWEQEQVTQKELRATSNVQSNFIFEKSPNIGLFCGYIGLFCGYMGLFCESSSICLKRNSMPLQQIFRVIVF